MTHQRLGQVDLETGEILEDGQLVYIPAKRRNGFQRGGFLTMAQDKQKAIAKSNLGLQAYRVLTLICSEIDYENWINVSQANMARELNMKPSNVSAALAQLIAEGIILKGPGVGTRKTYRLDPSYGWKGTGKTHRETLNSQTKLALVHNNDKRHQ